MNHYIKKISNNLWELLENNKKRIRHLIGTDVIIERLTMMTDIYIPAVVQHQKVFPKYKGINKGKTVVITGTGPTFDYYMPLPDAVHIGINNSIFREDIQYNYIFVIDYGNIKLFEKILSCEYDLIKFWGINYNSKEALIPEYLMEREDVETFYVEGYNQIIYGTNFESSRKFVYPPDLSVSPLKVYGTSFHSAFQFALWTHPEKIYIVGADCYGRSHARGGNYKENTDYDNRIFIKPWRKMKEFATAYYPDIEIVSLNPVGLKGMFHDEYTVEYKKAMEKL